MSLKQLPKPGVETAAALIGTAFSAMLLVLTAMNAGPLWRDEVNTLNMAQMPSLKDLWNNLPFESFPPLWPLLLRGCGFLGITDSDAGIRVLGLGVGLCFLASLWLCSRWMGGRDTHPEYCVCWVVCRRLSSSWERTAPTAWRVACWCSVSE